jgi:hypothetical protein
MAEHHLVIIGQLAFRVARTMPHIPHEYTQRQKQDARLEALFCALFHAIQADGVFERWKGRRKRYLYPGDGWKYWTVTNFLPMEWTINRMRIEADLARLRVEDPEAAAWLADYTPSRPHLPPPPSAAPPPPVRHKTDPDPDALRRIADAMSRSRRRPVRPAPDHVVPIEGKEPDVPVVPQSWLDKRKK